LACSGGGAAELVVACVVVAEAVGVAVEVEHDGAVQEPVEHGGVDGVSPRISPQEPTPRLVVITVGVLR